MLPLLLLLLLAATTIAAPIASPITTVTKAVMTPPPRPSLRHHSLDLRQLDRLPCGSDTDCFVSDTGMRCVQPFPGLNSAPPGGGDIARGFCECPRHSAYNATACRCQEAELCSHRPEQVG